MSNAVADAAALLIQAAKKMDDASVSLLLVGRHATLSEPEKLAFMAEPRRQLAEACEQFTKAVEAEREP